MGVDRLARYLYSFLPRDYAKGPRVRDATVWKSDIANFTKTTQAKIEEGDLAIAQFVTKIGEGIYASFDVLEQKYGGIVQYHEGDAGIAIFEDPELAVLSTVAVKEAISRIPKEKMKDGEFAFQIRQGIATGPVFTAVVGDDNRKICVIDGPAIDQAYKMEGNANVGHYCYLDDKTLEMTKDVFRFEGNNLVQKPDFDIEAEFEIGRLPSAAELLPYLPPSARKDAQGKHEGRNVKATILFSKMPSLMELAKLYGNDAEKLARAYQSHFMLLREIIENQHGGDIDKLYSGKVIASFTGPDCEQDAKQAALEMHRIIPQNEDIQDLLHSKNVHAPQTGYSTGEIYKGPIGSEHRKAFTILGGTVNTAARLQSATKTLHTDILTDSEKQTNYVSTIELKGLGKIKVHTPLIEETEEKPAQTRIFKKKTLIGRTEQKKDLAQILDNLQKEHKTQLASIVSDAGYGKTELTKEFEREFTGKIYKASAIEQASDIPDYILQDFTKNALGIRIDSTREEITAKLGKLSEENQKIIHHWLGLNLGYDKPALSREELEKARKQALVHIVEKTAEKQKLLIFNDIHWADENSIATIEWLATQIPDAIILTNYRPKEIKREIQGRKIELGPFSKQDIKEHASQLINQTPEENALNFIEAQSQNGNPLYIEEIVRYLQDQELLKEGKLTKTPEEINSALSDIKTDDGKQLDLIGKLVLQHYRNLKNAQKQTILDYAACMFGDEFPKHLLEKVLGKKAGELDETLEELAKTDFLKLKNGNLAFKHNLTRKAIYNINPPDKTIKRHTQIGDARKELYGEGEDQIVALAWDYENGEDTGKAMEYNWRAEKMFVERQQHTMGVLYADKIQKLFERIRNPTVDQLSACGTSLNGKLVALLNLGDKQKAEQTYEKSLEILSKLPENLSDVLNMKLLTNLSALFADDPERFRKIYPDALKAVQKVDNKYAEGLLNMNAAFAFGEWEFVRLTEEAIKLLSSFGDSYDLAMAYNNLAVNLSQKGDLINAKTVAEKGCKIADDIKNKDMQGRLRYDLAVIYDKMNTPNQALAMFREAEKFLEKSEGHVVLRLYSDYVDLCIRTAEIEMAKKLCVQWEKKCKTNEDKKELENKKQIIAASS